MSASTFSGYHGHVANLFYGSFPVSVITSDTQGIVCVINRFFAS
ncbi:hypothetical protein [Xenorhabdus doucetiae]